MKVYYFGSSPAIFFLAMEVLGRGSGISGNSLDSGEALDY
jgi:hypothetical protein